MNYNIKDFVFIFRRVRGAMLVFWILELYVTGEKQKEKRDYKRIVLAAFFGVGLNMLAFFKGLSYTTPISASVIMVTTPILVLIFSSIIIREKIPNFRIIGVIIGLVGAILLIMYGHASEDDASNRTLGNILVFINAIFKIAGESYWTFVYKFKFNLFKDLRNSLPHKKFHFSKN